MFLNFFWQQGPWDILKGLIISCCTVYRARGMVINVFYDTNFSNFWINYKKLFDFFESFYHVPRVWIFMSQRNDFRLEKRIKVSFVRQLYGS